jgi:hypothetical protein
MRVHESGLGERTAVAKLISFFFKSLRERQQASPSVHTSLTVPTRKVVRSSHECAWAGHARDGSWSQLDDASCSSAAGDDRRDLAPWHRSDSKARRYE